MHEGEKGFLNIFLTTLKIIGVVKGKRLLYGYVHLGNLRKPIVIQTRV
jgi:hypothetical protein